MKAIAVILMCLLGVTAVAVVTLRKPPPDNKVDVTYLVIKGDDNTLASVAEQVDDPDKFSYDPATRTAVCTRSLVIEGTLRLGDPDDSEKAEMLEMSTQYCGDIQLDVRKGGSLELYHSVVATSTRIITPGACTQGYALTIDGNLTMDHASFQYITGSQSPGLRAGATATLRNSSFTECDGLALRFGAVDGKQIEIENCTFSSHGEWSLMADGGGSAPVVVRNCVLDASYGVVNLAGEGAELHLIDCSFDKSKINFTRPSGRVQVLWTVDVTVEPAAGQPPAKGLRVVATSRDDCAIKETVEAITDEKGMAKLLLTEWVALPDAATATAGKNNSTPHVVKVYGEAAEPLAVLSKELTVRGKGQKIRISLGATRVGQARPESTTVAIAP